MEEEQLDQRVVVMMGRRELAAIDDWRFRNHIASRGEAIRQLIRAGFMAQLRTSKPEE